MESPDVIHPPKRSDTAEFSGPIIVLVPTGKAAFPMWPPHGAYVQGYGKTDAVRLAERELRVLSAYRIRERDCGQYIYWQVARVAHLQNGRSNGNGVGR